MSLGSASTRIAIAVVRYGDQVLVGKRGTTSVLPGMAEFPGGKVESEETPQAAAARECLEETGLDVTVGPVIADVVHRYDHGQMHLTFFACELSGTGVHAPTARVPFRWVPIDQLTELDFPAANRPVLRWLQAVH